MNEITKHLRCAVYTRKSTEEGLEQDYNSIDAQRDAGHAYIASQRAQGWTAVGDDYDDPAYSGGNIERPALQRLLQDITKGKIDIVIVYKIDRLTRSLNDFSTIIQTFEAHNTSFVSVTQQFNTTSSMGRLTLNMLLSFAQFEREVTGERIRDKIAASKRKGIWMGGTPPLGYDVKNRALIINPQEATLVQQIFTRFAEVGSTTQLVKELKTQGATSKTWVTQSGQVHKGRPIDKSMLYKYLHNRTYLGEIGHKGQWYKGMHKAIITQALWDNAHAILKIHHRKRTNQTRAKVSFLLKGLVFGADGRAFTTWSSVPKKSGRCYRYYLSTRENKEYAGASQLPRLPAGELESRVIEQIRILLQSPPELMQKIAASTEQLGDRLDESQVTIAMRHIDQIWTQLFPAEQTRIINLLIEKIIITADDIDIRFRKNGIKRLALEVSESALRTVA